MSRRSGLIIVAVVALAAVGFWLLGFSSQADRAEFEPDGHFVTMNAADTPTETAEKYYQSLLPDMRERYARSDDPAGKAYQDWQRFNTAPYRSETHGERYVNNYGNDLASEYNLVRQGRAMPVGAILAKDAFAITTDGAVYAQSLFLMEKLEKGRSPTTADWRYVMITPSGETYGDTLGENPDKVVFCHDCHRLVAESDYLFHIPEAFRAAE